jgi:hypothetical protein
VEYQRNLSYEDVEQRWTSEEVREQQALHQARVDETRRLHGLVLAHLTQAVGLSETEARLALGGLLQAAFLQDHELTKLELRLQQERTVSIMQRIARD